MKICPDCKYSNQDDQTICKICGADIENISYKPVLPEVKKQNKMSGRLLIAFIIGSAILIMVFYSFGGLKKEIGKQDNVVKSDKVLTALELMSELKNPDEKQIAIIVKSLASQNTALRNGALNVIYIWLENGVQNFPVPMEYFLNAMYDNNAEVRSTAVMRMGMLLEMARIKKDADKSACFLSTVDFKQRLSAKLEKLISEPYESIRENAAFCIGAARDKRLAGQLKKMMSDDQDIIVRLSAAGALTKMKDADAAGYLISQYDSADEDIRSLIAQYLTFSADGRADIILKEMSDDINDNVSSSADISIKTRKLIFNGQKAVVGPRG